MSKLNAHAAFVEYPTTERGTAFVPQDKIPFYSAVIGITNPDPGYSMTRREGNTVNVLEYVLEGEGEMLIGGERTRIKAGDCYVLVAGDRHEYRSNPQNPMKKIWINYIADYMSHLLAAYRIRTGAFHCPDARHIFEQLLEIANAADVSEETNYLIAESVHGIIHCIARSITIDSSDEYGIKRALAARVYSKLNLDELAADLHISKSQIIRSFKKNEGCTPYEYFLGLKIKTAKVLLRDTKMQIREIAEKLTVCDEHYFSALFHARTGMTPREYRASKK